MLSLFLLLAVCVFAQETPEMLRAYNRRNQLDWERENRDLVAKEADRVRASSSVVSNLNDVLVSSGLYESSESANKANLDFKTARPLGNGLFEQKTEDGRVIRFRKDKNAVSKPVVDICVEDPAACRGNLGVPRYAMPQFGYTGPKPMDDFLSKAREMGYEVKSERAKLGELRSFQSEILKSKVVKIADQQALSPEDQKKNFVPTTENYKPVVFGDEGRIIDGHHSWQGLKRAYGANQQIDVRRMVRRDGRELSRKDNLALWKAAIETKGVTTESLAKNAGTAAVLDQGSFIAKGKNRSRTGAAGEARRQHIQQRLLQRAAARKNSQGYVSQGVLRSRDGIAGTKRRAAIQVRWNANRAALRAKLNRAPLVMKGKNRSRGNTDAGKARRAAIQKRWDERGRRRSASYFGFKN